MDATHLSVSIGGGTSRLIAKLAAERAKPKAGADGVHIVAPGEELAFMRFTFDVANVAQLQRALALVRQLKGVIRVARG